MSYRPNRDFARELKRDPRTALAMRAAAELARARAEQLASAAGGPWMPSGGRQIVVEQIGSHVRLVNTDHAGHLLEWGSVNNPPHAPLRRGVRAAGLRLTEHGK